MSESSTVRVAPDVKLGQNVKLYAFVNLYGCEIGDESKIGTFVEIQKGARIGRRVKISSHTFICEGVTIEDEVFIGHGVMFINDKYPCATNTDGSSRQKPIGIASILQSSAGLRSAAMPQSCAV
jgi:UDP-3-O-[3-hydroxymyristoyl] glucosamine N-acyltransferase